MDRQMEFLMMWATVCQKMVDWYLTELEHWPAPIAKQHWQRKKVACQNDLIPNPDNRPDLDLSNQICQTAVLYMDCMVQWGVFDE